MSTEVLISTSPETLDRIKVWLRITKENSISGNYSLELKPGNEYTLDLSIRCSKCNLKAWSFDNKIRVGISDKYDEVKLVGVCDLCESGR